MINNLGYSTDFIFLKDKSIIEEFEGYMVIKSPENPLHFTGNFLLFNEAPEVGSRVKLEQIFDKHFSDLKEINHYNFRWCQSTENNYKDFKTIGYKYEYDSVLTLKGFDLIQPKEVNNEISIRKFQSADDWKAWVNFEREERDPELPLDRFEIYIDKTMNHYRNMTLKEQGDFYGAFIEDELVAASGLYFENGLGRFQQVSTKARLRRKKICTSLIYEMCKIGFAHLETLVIVADRNYYALDLYKKLGFKEKQFQFQLCLWDREKAYP